MLFDEQKVEVAGSLVLVAGLAAVVLHHLSARSGMPARDGGAALVRPADS